MSIFSTFKRAVLFSAACIAALGLLPSAQPIKADEPPKVAYRSALPDLGLAPELNNKAWLNTDMPLHLATQRGNVVLLEFWTFNCINCIHTLPTVQKWHESYAAQGLTVIGNHFPEFSSERVIGNIAAAIKRYGLTYAVAQDNDGASWWAYGQRYWPAIYLIDKQGHIRFRAIGEGGYEKTESVIQDLLKETYTAAATAETTVQPAKTQSETVVQAKTTARVYKEASTSSDQRGQITAQMVFVAAGEPTDGWLQITFDDSIGYVQAESVKVSTTGIAVK